MSLTIRPLKWYDVWAFAKLRNQIDGEATHLVASGGERKDNGWLVLARIILNHRLKTLVVTNDRYLVGYVSLVFAKFKKLSGNAYLTISIQSSHRGQGLGTKLMTAAEQLAKAHGARRIELEVFSQNPAVSLYRRLGYEYEGRKRQAIKNNDGFDDIILMAKFLN